MSFEKNLFNNDSATAYDGNAMIPTINADHAIIANDEIFAPGSVSEGVPYSGQDEAIGESSLLNI